MPVRKKTKSPVVKDELTVLEIEQGVVECCLLGRSPLICHAMTGKMMSDTMLPKNRNSQAEREATLRHQPYVEFRDSIYSLGPGSPTYIGIRASAFKAAISAAALDQPGTSKAKIGRLTFSIADVAQYVCIYGTPKMRCDVVKLSGKSRGKPDIRSTAIFPEWACRVRIGYTMPLIKQVEVVRLLYAAGLMIGVGDYRPEKGKGDFGQFEIVNPSNPKFKKLLKQGYKIQKAAMEAAEPFDDQTQKLLDWFVPEASSRGFEVIL